MADVFIAAGSVVAVNVIWGFIRRAVDRYLSKGIIVQPNRVTSFK